MPKKLKTLPKFKSEDEEREFWATHDSTDYFDWDKAKLVVFPNLKPTTQKISLRMPSWLLARIKSIANQRDVPYQSLMKMFLFERVRDEYGRSSEVVEAEVKQRAQL